MIALAISRRMSAKNQLAPVIIRTIRAGMQVPESLIAMALVCRIATTPVEAPASYVNKDSTFNFCISDCLEALINEPEEYL
jgi:hypothetical protein